MRGLGILVVAALALAGIASKLTPEVGGGGTVTGLLTERDPPPGFEYAMQPRVFEFPADHSAHPRFRSEWWYFTGNVDTEGGRAFGFQVTIFRFALTPQERESKSQWRRSNVYLGHFAISDIEARLFHNFERRSRPALDVAGVHDDPLKIWIRDWTIELLDPDNETWRVTAQEDGLGLDLTLRAQRPVTPQGDAGLSKKSAEPGNASYYYSIPRLAAAGTITTQDVTHRVRGNAWFDHEWSTSALAEGQLGWDWFSLQLDDGSDLMFYQIRDGTGTINPSSHALLLSASGVPTTLQAEEIALEVRNHWRSLESGVRYPAGWHIDIPGHAMELSVTPRFPEQEWRRNFTYWEGAVVVSGVAGGKAVSGKGYVELVGYD